MSTSIRSSFTTALLLSLLLLLQLPVAAPACPTCGCSELCAVNMFSDSLPKTNDTPLLSNSLWGNLILKIAYEHDPELQKLRHINKGVNIGTTGTLAAAAAGTLPQTTTSIVALNPPDGMLENYTPGIIGIALEGATNVALWTRLGLNAGLHKKVKARQFAIRQKVEGILHHLEFSQTNCPEARKELAQIIGEKAATECIDLWRSSHRLASTDRNPDIGIPDGSSYNSNSTNTLRLFAARSLPGN